MAGMGQPIGAKFDEFASILNEVNSCRLKIFLGTQHAFATCYDMIDFGGVQAMLSQLDAGARCSSVVDVHVNDSKCMCGSEVDRHENIGDGFIGELGFSDLMGAQEFSGIPFFRGAGF